MGSARTEAPPATVARRFHADRDAASACAYLSTAYGARIEPAPGAESVTVRHIRLDCGTYQLDELRLEGELTVEPGPDVRVLVVQVHRGSLALSPGCVLAPGRPLVTVPAERHRLTARSAVLEVTVLAVPLLREAAPVPAGLQPVRVRFTGPGPLDPQAARLWRGSREYVRGVLASAGAARIPPLLVGEAGRLLAATALAVFPNNLTGATLPADGLDATPDTLRRAVVFMEENAHADIGLGHIAAAAHVTPRALQYAFRRHAGTTPLAYLRRVRLERAHTELLAADPGGGTTVTAVAARWGFGHTGRFAAAYRQVYGVPPSVTLHG
ncbi:helix-turn-helix domain-containing protein [Streptomyces sp. NPDC046866]|uniref:AraC family transcriptional regulator n=1 Tax=Streptomyces sp. NPDC046866 TaxID=3154921 RepID=UPI003453D441